MVKNKCLYTLFRIFNRLRLEMFWEIEKPTPTPSPLPKIAESESELASHYLKYVWKTKTPFPTYVWLKS
jgi:hypothetical protein